MKPYPRYKSTGLAWLPSVPEHWELWKGKHLFLKAMRPVCERDEVVTCFRDGTVTLRKNRRLEGFTESLKEIGYQGIRKGDLVIHVMDAFAGAVGVSDSDGKATPVYSVCVPKHPEITNNYFYAYIVREMAKRGYIQSLYRGVRERSSDFRFEIFGQQLLPLPPPSEQERIVRYLDEKTAAIDELVRTKDREIELLRERKQALISAAVTRGLDSATKLKESDVPWIGKIPEAWQIVPLKRMAKLNPNCVLPVKGNEHKFVSFAPMECVRFDSLEHREAPLSNLNSSYSCFNEGDIAIAKVTPCFENGNCCIMTKLAHGFCFGSSELFCLRASSMIDKRFLLYLFRNTSFINGGCQTMSGSGGLKRVSSEFFRVTPIPVPPLLEQRQIVSHLDSVCADFAAAEAAIRKQITLLHELRTRLVSDAVTGAVEV